MWDVLAWIGIGCLVLLALGVVAWFKIVFYGPWPGAR